MISPAPAAIPGKAGVASGMRSAGPPYVVTPIRAFVTEVGTHFSHFQASAMAPSRPISARQAANLVQAIGHANSINTPLNRYVTINWQVAGVIGRVQDAQARFLERLRKWAIHRGFAPAYIWVLENSATNGLHAHYLLHVPSEHLVAFRRMLKRWVRACTTVAAPRIINSKAVRYPRGGDGLTGLGPVSGLLRYFLKGMAHGALANMLGVELRPAKSGLVNGRRCGTSENLGQAARRRAVVAAAAVGAATGRDGDTSDTSIVAESNEPPRRHT